MSYVESVQKTMSSESKTTPNGEQDVGSRLRAAREANEISLREIASTTKISVSALEALERNDFAELPGGIFTRAFVRAYASEVGLDPEQTTREFVAQGPVDVSSDSGSLDHLGPHAQDLFQSRFESQQRMVGTVLKLTAFVIPVAALLLFLGFRGVPTTDGSFGDILSIGSSSSVIPEVSPAPVSGGLVIELRPSNECWVSLTVDGDLQFEGTMRAGQSESYEANEEILLNIRNAGALDFAINQQLGRSLGGEGEVRFERITLENYRTYLAP